jgi:hypothetical protein
LPLLLENIFTGGLKKVQNLYLESEDIPAIADHRAKKNIKFDAIIGTALKLIKALN